MYALMLQVLRQTGIEQHGSDGSVWLMRKNPSSEHSVIFGFGHCLGLQDTLFVDSSHVQY